MPVIFYAALIAALLLAFAALFLYAAAPRRGGPDFPGFSGFFAHRGLHDVSPPYKIPENSLAAFSAAACRGYGIELDVRLTRDGELVVFHDDGLRRVCGTDARISELTAAELDKQRLYGGEHGIPRFCEVTELINGRVPLIIELKCAPGEPAAPLCRALSAALENYRGAYCVESFNPFVLRWYRKNMPGVFRGQLSCAFMRTGKITPLHFFMQTLTVNMLGRPDFIAYDCRHRKELGFRVCRRFYSAPAAAWTVRSQKQLDEIAGDFDCFIFEGFLPVERAGYGM